MIVQDLSRELHIDEDRLRRLIALAREEDLGVAGDITTQAVCGESLAGGDACAARMVARQKGVVCGLTLLPFILEEMCNPKEPQAEPVPIPSGACAIAPNQTEPQASACADPRMGITPPTFHSADAADGHHVAPGMSLGTIRGGWCAILSCERVLLNFVQRLSGVATLTRRFADAVQGTGSKVYDTRKTTPGWRDLEKYAVRCGGGLNHRQGLHDAILVKDNHLAGVPTERLAHHAFEILNQSIEQKLKPDFVEFEVDSLAQFEQLLKVVGIDVILLDNFSLDDLARAVEIRDQDGLSGKLALEASGGITLDTIRSIAETGVERISVGALTHSAVALDVSLEVPGS